MKEMGIPDHLTCLLRNLYASQEATVRTGHGITDWFQRVGFKLNIQKTKVVAFHSIISWQIDGETVETVSDFIFWLQNHCKW